MSIFKYSSSHKTKKLCKKVINKKSQAYKAYQDAVKERIKWTSFFVVANILIDPLAAISIPIGQIGPGSLEIWSLALLTIISSIIYFKNKEFTEISADWQSMIKKDSFTEDIDLSQVKNQLNENMKAVKTTMKIMFYFFTIIFIGSFEDTIKYFFVHLFNVHNFAGWFILLLFFGLITFCMLFLSRIIAFIYNLLKWLYIGLKSLFNRFIENGLFVKDYALLYATQKILEEKNKQ